MPAVTTTQSPDRIRDLSFRSLVVLSLLSTIVITLFASFGSYQSQRNRVVANTESRVFQLAESLLQREQGILLHGDLENGFQVSISEAELARLDSRLREFLHPFGIARISIYDDKQAVVYSSDRAMAGSMVQGNAALVRALSGTAISYPANAARLKNLAEEQMTDVPIVSTFVPFRDARGRVVGAFEFLSDVSGTRRELRGAVTTTAVVVMSVLALVWGCAVVVASRLSRRLSEAEEELQRMAITDPLTGIANRRQIMHRVAEEFSRYTRKRKDGAKAAPPCVVMADVDHFRVINDTYGHVVSDAVLREIAARIVHALRPYDLVGRFGGEEFLVLLPETELEEGWRVAERIRVGVANEAVRVEDHLIQVTASFGIACVQAGEKDHVAVLKRADSGMNRAKEAGNNQVICGEDDRFDASATNRP